MIISIPGFCDYLKANESFAVKRTGSVDRASVEKYVRAHMEHRVMQALDEGSKAMYRELLERGDDAATERFLMMKCDYLTIAADVLQKNFCRTFGID